MIFDIEISVPKNYMIEYSFYIISSIQNVTFLVL